MHTQNQVSLQLNFDKKKRNKTFKKKNPLIDSKSRIAYFLYYFLLRFFVQTKTNFKWRPKMGKTPWQKTQSFRLLSNKWLNWECELPHTFSRPYCVFVFILPFIHLFKGSSVPRHSFSFYPSFLLPLKIHLIYYTVDWIVYSFWFGRIYRNEVIACALLCKRFDLYRKIQCYTHSGGVVCRM